MNRASGNFVGGEGERVGQADVKSAFAAAGRAFCRRQTLSLTVTGTAFTCVLASAWGPWRRD